MTNSLPPFRAVVDHVRAAGATRSGRRSLKHWANTEPDLAPFPSAAALADSIRRAGPIEQDRLLLAILRVAHHDDLAQLVAVAGLTGHLAGHIARWVRAGLGRSDAMVVEADLVTECWVAVAGAAATINRGGDPPDRPGVVLPDRARQAVRNTRRRNRRDEQRLVPLTVEGRLPSGSRSTADGLATQIVDAVRAGALTVPAACIVYSTRVAGWTVAETARSLGSTPPRVRALRSRAERRLVAA